MLSAMSEPPTVLRVLQRAAARAPGAERAYAGAARAVGAALVKAVPGSAVYRRGEDEVLGGVSDIDLVHVVPDGLESASGRMRRRLQALLPGARRLLSVVTYEQRQLEAAVVAPLPLYPGPLVHRRPYLEDELWLRVRPGLYGPTDGWRLVAGAGSLPPAPPRDEQHERVAAWLELQWWWRHLIQACLEPERAYVTSLLGKLVAEPARILLWLEQRRRASRREALAEVEPDTARLAQRALRSAAPLSAAERAALLAAAVRLSARVAAHMDDAAAAAGATEVRLTGGRTPLPLLDARALTAPPRPHEAITVEEASLADPERIAVAARTASADRYRGVRDGALLLVVGPDLWPDGWLRTLQCRATDPVTFALLEGRETASFPNLAGWSIQSVARRAVDEHAAWLEHDPEAAGPSAARATALSRSLAEGRPTIDRAPRLPTP
jgi:hypothetical protein